MLLWVLILGYIAAIVMAISIIPQAVKTLKLKQADEISIYYMLLIYIGLSLFGIYGVYVDAIPVVLESVISIILYFPILYYSFKSRKNHNKKD